METTLTILNFAESETAPAVAVVRGHIPFADFGQAMATIHDNEDFKTSFYRYEYAIITELEPIETPPGDEEPIGPRYSASLNRAPETENAEPVTILYFGQYSVPQT